MARIQPCGERVLMVLAGQYPQYVTPLIADVFKQVVGMYGRDVLAFDQSHSYVHSGHPPADLPSIIQREALYCAIGRCAHRLKDLIPFDQWLEHDLRAQAQETNPRYDLI